MFCFARWISKQLSFCRLSGPRDRLAFRYWNVNPDLR
jgi:hypothetical protein